MNVREKLVELVNDVLMYLPWGEIQKDTAERIVDRIMDHDVTVQEWIPVNDERKPKEGEDVLVAVFDGYDTYTDIDCLMRDGKWCFETENYKVTHWMEKPEPPKGE